MRAPQIIVICLYAIATGITIAKHGKPREGKGNAIIETITNGIMIGLLIWGGFFKSG